MKIILKQRSCGADVRAQIAELKRFIREGGEFNTLLEKSWK